MVTQIAAFKNHCLVRDIGQGLLYRSVIEVPYMHRQPQELVHVNALPSHPNSQLPLPLPYWQNEDWPVSSCFDLCIYGVKWGIQDTNAGTLLPFEPWTVISTVNAIFHSVSVFVWCGFIKSCGLDTPQSNCSVCRWFYWFYGVFILTDKTGKCSIYSLTPFSEILMGQETLVNSCFLSTLSLSHIYFAE